jgi:2,5-diamino-6-(ribosylamino)-4(3H)-pyrimidinone 5'-phosphate reductase
MRPRVICHMAVSIDGRIATKGWPARDAVTREYERIHKHYAGQAWLCGRTTMEPFAGKVRSDDEVARQRTGPGEREDFTARGDFDSYAVAIDPSGKLAWESNDVDGDHVIAVVSTDVSDEYLEFLRARSVSYLVAGSGREIDLAQALEKLAMRFGIKTVMLEGGGGVNGSMLSAGLVDELSVLVVPVVDSRVGTPSLFDSSETATPVGLSLHAVERLDSGIVWLRYRPTTP